MNENIKNGNKIKLQSKFKKDITQKEEKKAKLKTKKRDYELTNKEYNERKEKCFFFLRRNYSQNEFQSKNINFKPISNRKWKKKFKEITKVENDLCDEPYKTKFPKKVNKNEKIIYDNLQLKSVWLNCKRIYNKCKSEYKPLIKKSIKNLKQIQNKTNKLDNNFTRGNKYTFSNINASSYIIPPISRKFERTNNRIKTLLIPKNTKIEFHKNSKSVKENEKKKDKENNFINCMERKINKNFVNKGINYIIKNRNLSKITDLPKFKSDEEVFIIGDMEKENEPSSTKVKKKMSVVFRSPISLDNIKNAGVIQYQINSFFEIATDKNNNIKDDEDEEETDLQILSHEGNIIIRELLFSKKENLESYKEKQSIFNFFCLKNIFDIDDYNIFGVINGKGKESKKFSRLLKGILIEKFSDEKNYFKSNKILQKFKNSKIKNDLIYNTLTLDGNLFIKNIFNSLNDDLKNKGVDIKETGATLYIIILIKDKIISIKVGDMYSYFIYSISNENNLNYIITKKPHLEHLISNIIEQDRFEDKCEFNLKKNEIGKNYYEIMCKDSECQKLLNEYDIQFTRMIGFIKLNKIGIIGEPDIQLFSMNIELAYGMKYSKNNKDFYFQNNYMKSHNINFDEGKLKFIMIGNNELFEYLKSSYYIKEINEALLKDEQNDKKKENIKYWFNLKNKVKKLVNESSDIHKKYMKIETFKDRCMALVTLT